MNKAEQRIAQLEEENRQLLSYKSTVESSVDGIMLIDSDGVIREWGGRFEQITGLDKEIVVDKLHLWEMKELVYPFDKRTKEDFERVVIEQKDLVANMRETAFLRPIKHYKTGKEIILDVVYFRVELSNKTMLGCVGRDVTDRIKYSEELEKLTCRQDILFKVQDIVQKTDDLYQAMSEAIAEIGKYAGVSRVHIFKNSEDGKTFTNTVEWCNDGIYPIKELLQDLPIDLAHPWFNMIDKKVHTCFPNDPLVTPDVRGMMITYDVKSMAFFPLSTGDTHYGFIDFNECRSDRIWDNDELELLKSLSQIISTTKSRIHSQEDMKMERDRLKAIGDNFPRGSLFRFEVNPKNSNMSFTYLSATWEKLMGVSIKETMADASKVFSNILPEFLPSQLEEIKRCTTELTHFLLEYQIRVGDKIRWMQTSSHPTKISNEKVVFDGFILDITARKIAEEELRLERDRIRAIGDNFPGGALFRWELIPEPRTLRYTYLSKTWSDITGLDIQKSLDDLQYSLSVILHEDVTMLINKIRESEENLTNYLAEVRFFHQSGEIRWLQISATPNRVSEDLIVFDGFILDISARKRAELELVKHRNELEMTVQRRTEELQCANEEIKASSEEMQVANEELQAINEELYVTNEELHRYQNQLETMVAEKTQEIYTQHKSLEKLSRSQTILIKVLQIMQSSENMHQAINRALAEIGFYTGVSRVYVVVKHENGKTFSVTHEWCTAEFTPTINDYQDQSIDEIRPYFAIFNSDKIIKTSDINTLPPQILEINIRYKVKSVLNLPLTNNGIHYGFVGFDDCVIHRNWDDEEVELLKSLSQIISSTERRYHAENELIVEHARLQSIGDNFPHGALFRWEVDIETKNVCFTYLSKPWTDITGLEIKKSLDDISYVLNRVMPEDTAFLMKRFKVEERTEENYSAQVRMYHNVTGDLRWLQIDGHPHFTEDKIIYDGFILDITDRKRTEIELANSQQSMRTVLDNIGANIFVCDLETMEILFANKTLKDVAGGIELEGQECWKVLQVGQTGICDFCPRNIIRDENNRPTGLHRWERYSEKFERHLAHNTVAIDWIDGRSVQLEIAFDITENKRTEAELINAKEKAEESDKLKSAFLANMSHEIRTPVNGIVGFLHFLASDNLSPQRKKEYSKVIENSSAQLVKLIDDVIDVAKIEAKQMTIFPVPVNVNGLMRELQIFFETILHNKNKGHIMLILDDSDFIEHCVAFVDPMRLRQVLSNLITNAVKFTEKGYIRIGYRQSAPDKLEFVVEDTGIGLSVARHEVIFERFRQAEVNTAHNYGGTGLGLNIAQSLIKMMGGDIRLESEENVGTIFYFDILYIPITDSDRYILEEHTMQNVDKPYENKIVLVVEPEILKYKYYEMLLVSVGFTVLHATNINQWVDAVNQTTIIDVVIIDGTIFDNATKEQLKLINSVRTGIPKILVGANENNTLNNSHNIKAPLCSDKLLEAMKAVISDCVVL